MAGNCHGGSNPKYKPGLQGPAWNNHQGEEDAEIPECGYHHCQVDTNLYSMGWDSFGQAWDIWTNPSSSYGQQWLAGSYMSYWGGAHLIGAAGIYLLATQYIIAATLLNIGVNVGIDAMIVTSGGNKYTHEQAFATAAFSVIMGATSGAITKSIGFNTSRQFLKNLGWQATLQFGGNSANRAINGQPTTVSDFVTDVSAGVPSTIFQMPHMQIGNPNSSSQIGEAFSAILSGLGGYPDNNPVLIPAP